MNLFKVLIADCYSGQHFGGGDLHGLVNDAQCGETDQHGHRMGAELRNAVYRVDALTHGRQSTHHGTDYVPPARGTVVAGAAADAAARAAAGAAAYVTTAPPAPLRGQFAADAGGTAPPAESESGSVETTVAPRGAFVADVEGATTAPETKEGEEEKKIRRRQILAFDRTSL